MAPLIDLSNKGRINLFLHVEENELAAAFMRVRGLVWRNAWLTVLPDDIPLLKKMDPTDTIVLENSVIGPIG